MRGEQFLFHFVQFSDNLFFFFLSCVNFRESNAVYVIDMVANEELNGQNKQVKKYYFFYGLYQFYHYSIY